jgi:predicted unusual protein kinase regulating ubiquinone biosynthesis (AarF/ABC1/UbiB family)
MHLEKFLLVLEWFDGIKINEVGSYTKQTQRFMKEAFLALLARDARSLVKAWRSLASLVKEA